MKNILNEPTIGTTAIPAIAFCLFQLMCATTATTIVIGAVSERGRMWPTIIFTFIWCTLVYNFISYWIWSPNGWAHALGSLDHAGGVPIHISAGTSALVYSLVLGKRQTITNAQQNKPHNVNNLFIGTLLTWFGWFCFNGGSGLVVSIRTVIVCIVTNLAACTGGLTWSILDYFLSSPKHKFSLVGFCMGSMSGLVCITPGSGFVSIPASIMFGIGGSICVYFGRKIKNIFQIDDAFDIFAQHGIGGFTGCILTGIFAEKSIPELDLVHIQGGWLDGCWMQVIYQLVFASAGFAWSFVITLIILLVMNNIPGLSLRTTVTGEIEGIDYDQFNEYTHDYIELQRDLYATLYSKPSLVNENAMAKRVDTVHEVQQQNNMTPARIQPISMIANAW
ncbi:unnamed protein product [Rotaria sp. Silwood2]|nr:unnamed protein product [Rotaria sp. Silwood2]CAF4114712.1 unnamed protein product [Rotaria sp. Silwood2]CAF4223289.1 unnamed protein product [Rotaria sp. Silwood2]